MQMSDEKLLEYLGVADDSELVEDFYGLFFNVGEKQYAKMTQIANRWIKKNTDGGIHLNGIAHYNNDGSIIWDCDLLPK